MFNTFLRQTGAGLRLLLVLTVLTGILYPLGIWAIARTPGLRHSAEGSVVRVDGRAVGSELIGIDPTGHRWFHQRPASTAGDVLGPADASTSGGSNKASDSTKLVETIAARRERIAAREGVSADQVPADAVTASASGLDPHISPEYARLQITRVDRANNLPQQRVVALVDEHTDGRDLGFVGQPRVDVGGLNRALSATRG